MWKDYFAFNKRQRNGILILISLIALMLIYLLVSDYFPPSQTPVDFSAFKSAISHKPIANSNSNSQQLIDINTADTTQLMTLPKMTTYCANMIVRYRKKLGGYYDTKQLKEVWGMDSVIYKELMNNVGMIQESTVQKLNINTADIKQLAYHPYIHYYLAKAIVNYREQHGLYKSLSDLHNIVAIDDSTYARITPYLMVRNK